jgi:hypothetical protein
VQEGEFSFPFSVENGKEFKKNETVHRRHAKEVGTLQLPFIQLRKKRTLCVILLLRMFGERETDPEK